MRMNHSCEMSFPFFTYFCSLYILHRIIKTENFTFLHVSNSNKLDTICNCYINLVKLRYVLYTIGVEQKLGTNAATKGMVHFVHLYFVEEQ